MLIPCNFVGITREKIGRGFGVENRPNDLFQFSSLCPADVESVQGWLEELLAKLRPNAVGLVDSFDLPDAVVRSALGAWDGRVYERLFEEASKSPLNQEPVNISFKKYLQPFLRSNL